MKNYFDLSVIRTVEELKKVYRSLCLTMHPDKGGNTEDFQEMQNQYEDAAAILSGETPRARRTTTTRREAVAVRRGMSVIFFGAGMMETRYIIVSVDGDKLELVRLFSHDFESLDDVEYFDEESDRTSRQTLGKYDRVRPLSEKFGIGFYFDDLSGKMYTDEEIKEAERVADNFDKWIEVKTKQEAEAAAKAKAEQEAREAAAINEWRGILEELPNTKGFTWEQRKEQQKAEAKAKAAFKRNIKAVFSHYFPGVKVSVKDSAKCWCESSAIEWTDGPTVAEVEAVKEWAYFRGWFFECDPYADYGSRKNCSQWGEWRRLFGEFSDDKINFVRTLSEENAARVADAFEAIGAEFESEERPISRNSGSTLLTWSQLRKFAELVGIVSNEGESLPDDFARYFSHQDEGTDAEGCSLMRAYRSRLVEFAAQYMKIEAKKESKTTTERPQTDDDHMTKEEAARLILEAEKAGKIERYEMRSAIGWDLRFSGRGTYAIKKALKVVGFWAKEAKAWAIYEYFSPLFALDEQTEPTTEDNTTDQDTTTEQPTAETSQAYEGGETSQPAEEADPLADELAEALRKVEEIRARMAQRDAERKAEQERKEREAIKAAAIAAVREEMERAEAEKAAAVNEWREAEKACSEAAARLSAAGERRKAAFDAAEAAAAHLEELTKDDTTDEQPATPSDLEGVYEFANYAMKESEARRQYIDRVRVAFAKAAKESDNLTEENDHTEAVYNLVLAFLTATKHYTNELNQLGDTLNAIEQSHAKRGYITDDEQETRLFVAYRAAQLCGYEFGEELARLLFGSWCDPIYKNDATTAAA